MSTFKITCWKCKIQDKLTEKNKTKTNSAARKGA